MLFFLDIVLLHTLQTIVQWKHNFYMHWETNKQKIVWLSLQQWSGTISTIFVTYGCNNFNYIGKVCFLPGDVTCSDLTPQAQIMGPTFFLPPQEISLHLKKSRNTEAKDLNWFSVCMLKYHDGRHNDGKKRQLQSGAKVMTE